MIYLAAGLVIFFAVHSVRIVADDWRTAQLERVGPGPWKGLYSVASIVGFVLIVYGFGLARHASVMLWAPPVWTRHLAALLTLLAFILFAAAYVPGTHIKAKVKHPMVLGVKAWAIAHLLSNGTLADVVLFGAFLVWAVFSFRAARQRDRQQGLTYPAAGASRDVIAIVVGIVAWGVFALYLHPVLFRVRPFG